LSKSGSQEIFAVKNEGEWGDGGVALQSKIKKKIKKVGNRQTSGVGKGGGDYLLSLIEKQKKREREKKRKGSANNVNPFLKPVHRGISGLATVTGG